MSIESEILALKGNRELLTAEEVVEWAHAHPKSALYSAPEFCGWDLKKSAYEHWLWGARRLIALHVTYQNGERRFYSLTTDRMREGGGYRDLDDILRDKTLHEILLSDALRELERIQLKYEKLNQLKPVWNAVRKVKRRTTERREHMAKQA